MKIAGGTSTSVEFTDLLEIASNLSKIDNSQFIRFSDARGIYSHGGISFGAVKDVICGLLSKRSEKKEIGAELIKLKIDKAYGGGTADRVFKSIENKAGVNLNEGVRLADLAKIDKEIKIDQEFRKHMPVGMQIAPNGRVGGFNVVKETFPMSEVPERDQPAKPKQSLSVALTELGKEYCNAAFMEKAEGKIDSLEPEVSKKIAVTHGTIMDLRRMNFNLHVPESNKDDGAVKINEYSSKHDAHTPPGKLEKWVDKLVELAGSTQAASVVANVCRQANLRPMFGLIPSGEGKQVAFVHPNSKSETVTFTNLKNEKVRADPSQFGGAKIDIKKTEEGDFEFNIHWELLVDGVRHPDTGEVIKAHLDPDDALMLKMKTTWVIDGAQAQKGNLELSAAPVHITYHGKLATATN